MLEKEILEYGMLTEEQNSGTQNKGTRPRNVSNNQSGFSKMLSKPPPARTKKSANSSPKQEYIRSFASSLEPLRLAPVAYSKRLFGALLMSSSIVWSWTSRRLSRTGRWRERTQRWHRYILIRFCLWLLAIEPFLEHFGCGVVGIARGLKPTPPNSLDWYFVFSHG